MSILEVKTPTEIRRLTGTMMGGGTLIGLSKLLINVDNYIDILNLAREGDNTQVDRLVGDIYGGGGSSSGLEAETISASFGKINKFITNKNELRKEDIAKSLLLMIVYHIGELAYLQAKQRNIDT